MTEKKCFFVGNRHAPGNIKESVKEAVEKHIIEYGVTTFIVGHYGDFDRLVSVVLREMKEHYPHIKVFMLAPYALTQKVEVPKGFDGSLYPDNMEKVPKPLAIVQANKKMIDSSNYLIAFCQYSWGNTGKFVEYAKKRENKGLIKITLL